MQVAFDIILVQGKNKLLKERYKWIREELN